MCWSLSLSKLILQKRHGYRKKYGHMKVQVKKGKKNMDTWRSKKKEKIAISTKESKERERIMQNGVTTNQMVITSTQSGPSVHLTITTFIIDMVISSTHSGPSTHLAISIISLHMHILIRLYDLIFSLDPVFYFTIHVMQVCLIFIPYPKLHI
jgi:hypothetical protein